jgi:glycosyltransferase involved in cell wall biosynthesis
MESRTDSCEPHITPLRIAFCVPDLSYLPQATGAELNEAAAIQQAYIAAGLHARGHSLRYVAPANFSDIFYCDELQPPVKAKRTWTAGSLFSLSSKVTWKLQKSVGIPYFNVFSNLQYRDGCLHCLNGCHVVHERNSIYNTGVAMACRRLKLPYVLFFDADQLAEHDYMGQPISGLLRLRATQMLQYNLKAADAIICVTRPARDRLLRKWHVPSEKITIMPNAADIHSFRPCPQVRQAARAELGLTDEPVIVFVGSFYNWHDTGTLIEAFACLLLDHPDARLLLVGDGEQRPALIERVAQLNIGHAVRFLGLVAHADVPHVLDAADIAVALYPPMEHELWLSPMKLFEYMAAGKAIIASAVGQVGEVIQEWRNGLLAAPGNVDQVAAALKLLVENPKLRADLGRQARCDAERLHSWDSYVRRLERIYAAAISREPVGHEANRQPERTL